MNNDINNTNETIAIDPAQQDIYTGETNASVTTLDIADAAPADNEKVAGGTKFKVLAAIGIMAVAGYLAYWVQEPVQVKTDVLNNTPQIQKSLVAQNTTAGEIKDVDLSLFGFEPAVLKIKNGDSVRFTNTSSEEHTIIGEGTEGTKFESEILISGDTFTQMFDKDEEIEYYSTYNPALKATITVGTGSMALAEETADTESTVTETANENEEIIPVNTATNTEESEVATESEVIFGSAEEDLDAPIPVLSTSTINNTIAATTDVAEDKEDLPAAEKELTAQEKATQALEDNVDTHAAAEEGKLAKTGPEDALYVLVLAAILYFNRKKLASIRR